MVDGNDQFEKGTARGSRGWTRIKKRGEQRQPRTGTRIGGIAASALRRCVMPMSLRQRASILDCASPLALWKRSPPGTEPKSARGQAQSKTWRPSRGYWRASLVWRPGIGTMNRERTGTPDSSGSRGFDSAGCCRINPAFLSVRSWVGRTSKIWTRLEAMNLKCLSRWKSAEAPSGSWKERTNSISSAFIRVIRGQIFFTRGSRSPDRRRA